MPNASRPIVHLHRLGRRPDIPPTVGVVRVYAANGAPLRTLAAIEPPWKQNARRVSCIPPGVYSLRPRTSDKFGAHLDVIGEEPARGLVLIHAGNTVADTEGCILIGLRHGHDSAGRAVRVVESRRALDILRRDCGSAAWLVITADAAHA